MKLGIAPLKTVWANRSVITGRAGPLKLGIASVATPAVVCDVSG